MYTFKKTERLTSNVAIKQLFAEGKSKTLYPYKIIWESAPGTDVPVKVVMSVSKRNFKRAVDRNKIRRRMREAYRLNKARLFLTCKEQNKAINLAIIYIAREEQEYTFIQKKMIKVLDELIVRDE